MTRESTIDFDKLKKYVDEYTISGNLEHEEYVQSLKKMHKCYFSAIAWSAELEHGSNRFLEIYTNSNEEIIYRLTETVSDLGSSFFNWLNGNYKASRVMLRVSIENFVRAVSGLEDKSQLAEKSVYKVFDVASNQIVFNDGDNPLLKINYQDLHQQYKDLCADAHTATVQNMDRLSSLADFPAFHSQKSTSTADAFVRVSSKTTTLFCIIFNQYFHGMYHRNKENILNSLSREIKPIINAPKRY